MNDMNMFSNPSPDINSIQNASAKSGFSSRSRVSFDMFKFNSMINDYRSDDVNPKPELLSRQSIQNEQYTRRPEDIKQQPETFGKSHNVHTREYSKKSEHGDGAQKDSDITTTSDKKENIQDRNNINETSGRAQEHTETAMRKSDQCSDGADRNDQQPVSDSIAENGKDKGNHIGLFLSNILDSDVGGLITDNLINEGEGSIVSEIAQSGNKSELEIDLKTGNLLSHLIKDEIGSAKTSGVNGDIKTGDIIARMNNIQVGTAEAGADGKSSGAVNGKLAVPEAGVQACSDIVNGKLAVPEAGIQTDEVSDSLSEKPAKANEGGLEENLMKVQVKAQGKVSGESGKNTDDSGRNIIESDRKSDIKENNIKQYQNNITDPAFKDIQNGQSVIMDKPLTQMTENIHMGSASNVSTDSNVRFEGTSSESNNNGMMNNSNTSHESIKTGEGLKTASTTRPSAFNEVVDKITYIVKGSTKLGVRVESELLGKLNINVSIEKGLVNVHINSADKAVREFIDNNMQQIVDSLSKNGVSVGGFSVGLRNNKNNAGNENMNGNGRGNPFSVDGIKEREYISAASRGIHSNGLVNIFA